MKKLMEFVNYVVGAVALLGLAGGITYGLYTAGGVVWAGMAGVVCLAMLVTIALGMSGKFNEKGEKGFPAQFAAILVLGSGFLVLIIALGAGLSSLNKSETARSTPMPVATATASPSVSSPNASPSSAPAVGETPVSSVSPSPVVASPMEDVEAGFPPLLLAILVSLAVLIALIWLIIILKQGGNSLSSMYW